MKFVTINFRVILYILCALFGFSRQKAKSFASLNRSLALRLVFFTEGFTYCKMLYSSSNKNINIIRDSWAYYNSKTLAKF